MSLSGTKKQIWSPEERKNNVERCLKTRQEIKALFETGDN